MTEPKCKNHNPESSKPKNNRYKIILKWVLKAVIVIWRLYKPDGGFIEFLKELLD